ncbi:two-component system, NtrC family, response regulator HydG [Cyclobacterium xiamenense]|uniref:Two-component system, NtrC family, response regulator HydG n=1 Tax=Cyclobacterium xiamenense TaxID=1297121 RepID=A0A1H7BE56_9BACT|nr:sigma-54 dependent transcriptional regulator [Cyclobacterium xiamenense]SEJ75738.1 two-component system, NtrC family, response regulator HydG [Cyclobacterium xiamenense]
MAKILLIEDDLTYSKIIKNFLEKNGYEINSCTKVAEGLQAFEKNKADLIITDYRLPDGTGMEVLDQVIGNYPDTPVILITNYSDIRTAVKSMKMGAFEYITKPINPDELLLTVRQALKKETKRPDPVSPNRPAPARTDAVDLSYQIGNSSGALQIEKHIELVAPTDLSIIVLGESGTGKEYISKRIHQKSKRAKGPFVAVDCGALSRELAGSELFGHVKGAFTGAIDHKTGHFENANGGTIFLDEIGNLSYEIQIKLLRAIQERQIRKIGGNRDISVDVRIIAATNEDLQELAKSGQFREDLFHRLNEFSITAQPLRERREDLPFFARLFLEKSNESLERNVTGFSPDVEKIFGEYHWPGNLRELKNIIRRAVLLTGEGEVKKEVIPSELLDREDLPTKDIHSATDLKFSFEEQEKSLILKTLEEMKFNKSKTAKMLNMDRKTLYNKLEKYGLD